MERLIRLVENDQPAERPAQFGRQRHGPERGAMFEFQGGLKERLRAPEHLTEQEEVVEVLGIGVGRHLAQQHSAQARERTFLLPPPGCGTERLPDILGREKVVPDRGKIAREQARERLRRHLFGVVQPDFQFFLRSRYSHRVTRYTGCAGSHAAPAPGNARFNLL